MAINPSGLGGPPDSGLSLGNVLPGFFQTPTAINKVDEFYKDADILNRYRPERAQGLLNALGNRSTAYQGAENAMASMYGSQNAQPPSQLMSNPMSGDMLGLPGPMNGYGSPENNAGMAASINRGASAPFTPPAIPASVSADPMTAALNGPGRAQLPPGQVPMPRRA